MKIVRRRLLQRRGGGQARIEYRSVLTEGRNAGNVKMSPDTHFRGG